MTVNGGVSFGAASSLSENGLTVFGSVTNISSLHHEICKATISQCKICQDLRPYSLIAELGLFDV